MDYEVVVLDYITRYLREDMGLECVCSGSVYSQSKSEFFTNISFLAFAFFSWSKFIKKACFSLVPN